MIIRTIAPKDVKAVLELIKGLALYEKAPEQVVNTEEGLTRDLFQTKICEGIIAEEEGRIIGFAIYFTSYSTWKGPCIYLEDLFVLETERKNGAGSLLFDKVVEIAKERGVKRMDWQVLDWNEPAINFYKKKGALLDPEWINGRLFF